MLYPPPLPTFPTTRRSAASHRRVPVTASVRASGYDDLPDTYYVHTIPDRVGRIGVGTRLIISVGPVLSQSVYAVTIGPVRVRAKSIVEFVGFSDSFLHNMCYIQLPLDRARVSRFPFLDALHGMFAFVDPIPKRRIRFTTPVPLPPAANDDLADDDIADE